MNNLSAIVKAIKGGFAYQSPHLLAGSELASWAKDHPTLSEFACFDNCEILHEDRLGRVWIMINSEHQQFAGEGHPGNGAIRFNAVLKFAFCETNC